MESVEGRGGDKGDGRADHPCVPGGIGLCGEAEQPGRDQKAKTGNDIDDIKNRPGIRIQGL